MTRYSIKTNFERKGLKETLISVVIFRRLRGKSGLTEKMHASSKNSELHPHILFI